MMQITPKNPPIGKSIIDAIKLLLIYIIYIGYYRTAFGKIFMFVLSRLHFFLNFCFWGIQS